MSDSAESAVPSSDAAGPPPVFSLEGKGLRLDTADDAAPYVAQLTEHAQRGLVEVRLSGNTLGPGAAQALAAVLATCTSLRVADMSDIFTGRLIHEVPEALTALCTALASLVPPGGALEEVNLSDNAFGGRSVDPLVPLLEGAHGLRILKLNNNGLGPEGGAVVAAALARGASEAAAQGEPSQLRVLVCGRNRLEDGSASDWARALAAHGNLEEVRMKQNGIRMRGIETIVRQGLAMNPHLRILDLQDNTATLRGSKAVAETLHCWPHLVELELTETLLRPKGGQLILNALSEQPPASLRKLGLGFCDLSPTNLSALAKIVALPAWPQLSHLNVNGNLAEEDGPELEALRQSLEAHGLGDALAETDEMEDPAGLDDLSDDDLSDASSEASEEEVGEGGGVGDTEEAAPARPDQVEAVSVPQPSPIFTLEGKSLKLDTESDIEPYLRTLREQVGVEQVVLSGNTLGVAAAEALADTLGTLTSLKSARLDDIFTGRTIEEIPLALSALCTALARLVPPHGQLEEVDLSDNAFGGRSVEPLVPLLEVAHSLRVLRLANNGLGPEGGTVVADALARGADRARQAGQSSHLRVLVCGRNRLENGSAAAWARALEALGGLEEVRLYQNGIRMEGIEAIVSQGLVGNPKLKVLDLKDNTATLRGSRAVANALPLWPDLEVLELSEVLLRPRGANLLVTALRSAGPKKLRHLGLGHNDIPARHLEELAELITHHAWALDHLNVNGNFAEEDGPEIEALRDALVALGRPDALAETDEMEPGGEAELSDEDEDEDEDGDESAANESIGEAEVATQDAAPVHGDETVIEIALSESEAPDAKSTIVASPDVAQEAEEETEPPSESHEPPVANEGPRSDSSTEPPLKEDALGEENIANDPDSGLLSSERLTTVSTAGASPPPKAVPAAFLDSPAASLNGHELNTGGAYRDASAPLDRTNKEISSVPSDTPGTTALAPDEKATEVEEQVEADVSLLISDQPIESLAPPSQCVLPLDWPREKPQAAFSQGAVWELLDWPTRVLVFLSIVLRVSGCMLRRCVFVAALLCFGLVLWSCYVAWQATPPELIELVRLDLDKNFVRPVIRALFSA